ncbi:MAG: hypothetical protein WCC66_06880 [Rhizobiaceae bacterium]
MNLSMKLTMEGLTRALRWKGLQASDLHQTRDRMGDGFEPVGVAAAKIVNRIAQERKP